MEPDCTHNHAGPKSALHWLCESPRWLARHRAWLIMPSSMLAGPRFVQALADTEQACRRAEALQTRPLCPSHSEGVGLYAASELQETACSHILRESPMPRTKRKGHGRDEVLTGVLNASGRPSLGWSDRKYCWAQPASAKKAVRARVHRSAQEGRPCPATLPLPLDQAGKLHLSQRERA